MVQGLMRAQFAERARQDATLARKKSYQRLVGLGLGGAGLAAMICGLPDALGYAFWGLGGVSWMILKAV